KIRRRVNPLDHRIHERRVVGRVYPTGIADGVVEVRLLNIELEMPRLLPRARLVQPRARVKHHVHWTVARAATLGGPRGTGGAICDGCAGRWNRGGARGGGGAPPRPFKRVFCGGGVPSPPAPRDE